MSQLIPNHTPIKYITLLVLVSLLVTGCSSNNSPDISFDTTQVQEESDNAVSEVELDGKYTHLRNVELEVDSAKLTVYIPNDSMKRSSSYVSGQKGGIEVSYELFKDEVNNASQLANSEVDHQGTVLASIPDTSDINPLRPHSNGDIELREINYTITKETPNDTGIKRDVYPCQVIIRVDHLSDGYYLKTIINANNYLASDETPAIYSEVRNAVGVS